MRKCPFRKQIFFFICPVDFSKSPLLENYYSKILDLSSFLFFNTNCPNLQITEIFLPPTSSASIKIPLLYKAASLHRLEVQGTGRKTVPLSVPLYYQPILLEWRCNVWGSLNCDQSILKNSLPAMGQEQIWYEKRKLCRDSMDVAENVWLVPFSVRIDGTGCQPCHPSSYIFLTIEEHLSLESLCISAVLGLLQKLCRFLMFSSWCLPGLHLACCFSFGAERIKDCVNNVGHISCTASSHLAGCVCAMNPEWQNPGKIPISRMYIGCREGDQPCQGFLQDSTLFR